MNSFAIKEFSDFLGDLQEIVTQQHSKSREKLNSPVIILNQYISWYVCIIPNLVNIFTKLFQAPLHIKKLESNFLDTTKLLNKSL